MRVGITMFATDRTMPVTDLARAAEDHGFASLWLPEHTHIPAARTTPPPTPDAVLAEDYARTLDPFTALAAAAAVTSRLRVGTGIALVAQRDPIVTAKAVATLDLISSGRLSLGVGYGWNVEEMANHGVDPSTRRARVRESVLAMQRIWRNDRAAFDGEFVRFDELWSWPKPVQPDGPPVLIGGAPGATLFAHIAEFADGWIPIGGGGVADALPALHDAFRAAGRDPADAQVVCFGTVPDPAKLAYLADVGVDEVALRIPAGDADTVLPLLDRYAAFV